SPTLENFVVLTWLRLIHPELPKIVKQRYGTELRHPFSNTKPRPKSSYKDPPRHKNPSKLCPLCKEAGRSNITHYLRECNYLPERDRRYMLKARQISHISESGDETGTPFMELNDLCVRPAKRQVILADGTIYQYGSSEKLSNSHSIRRAQVPRAPSVRTVVLLGEFLEVEIPKDFVSQDRVFALEPRVNNRSVTSCDDLWPPPKLISSVSGKIRIPNLTEQPQSLKGNEHFCQVLSVFVPDEQVSSPDVPTNVTESDKSDKYSKNVQLDPDNILHESVKAQFRSSLEKYDEVFNPNFQGYNGASGPIKGVVNMGPTKPPQRKGHLPLYSRDKLSELQQKFDELTKIGVFKKPEDI
ncbi:hypothetical protein ScPMuIL_002143, partial [Solemya velum]